MTDKELKVILAAAYCLNNLPDGRERANDLLAYTFKQYFGIDVKKLSVYCAVSGKRVITEITDILVENTNYKRRF